MNFVKVPNLPVNNVKVALVDSRISEDAEKCLASFGIEAIKTFPYPGVYEAVACHPDICFHHVGDNLIVYAPGVDETILERLSKLGFELLQGSSELTSKYPGNIAYNAARIGNIAVHNLKYIDSILRDELEKRGVKLIHVNQGYAKCSVSVIDNESVITADSKIASALDREGIDVLLIEPEQNILLPGLDMGFIGGSTGQIGSARLAFSGSLEKLKSYKKIMDFLERKGLEAISLTSGPVVDIGSILPIIEE